MELIERDDFLAALTARLAAVAAGEGHCVLVTGEAGMGKSSLVKGFRERVEGEIGAAGRGGLRGSAGGAGVARFYVGLCDALFTPRPLAPVYDVAGQMGGSLWKKAVNDPDRSVLFASFYQDLADRQDVAVIVFEDIHWADEATLDLIKFLARRIARVRCLFVLTYRDNEVHSHHPLRSVLGGLPADFVTRLALTPLSKAAVKRLAAQKGYNGEEVFAVTDGIPFYVKEILAAYSPGIPENIKDSILAVYDRQPEDTRRMWELLSVMPGGFETGLLGQMASGAAAAIGRSLDARLLILRDGRVFFNHELYRRTIEAQLSPLERITLNKRVLELFLPLFEQQASYERIIHHAQHAEAYELVVRYAPMAARQAAAVGAHGEAARLFLSAIDNYKGGDKEMLLRLYEGYAYECYITHRLKEAIDYQKRALVLHRETGEIEKTGECLRFLSRIWWFEGNREWAEHYAGTAIEVLKNRPSSREKAMAFSNMSQLKMLSNQATECIYWGERAIAIARELGDEEILSHALNNVGTVRMGASATRSEGQRQLEESLRMALQHSYHEHAARAYTNLGSVSVQTDDLVLSRRMLDEGIRYCEDRDLDSWAAYMSGMRTRLLLRTGEWDEARLSAERILANAGLSPIVRIMALVVMATIRIRRGEGEVLPLLQEAQQIAAVTMELQRIIPVLLAQLEYEWIKGERLVSDETIDSTIDMIARMGYVNESSEFAFWLLLVRKRVLVLPEVFAGWRVDGAAHVASAAAVWEGIGSPYSRALVLFVGDAEARRKAPVLFADDDEARKKAPLLFAGDDDSRRKALMLVQELGAGAVVQRMKMELRAAGVKNLPRGARETTKSNAAFLTPREIDVLRCLKEGMKNKEIAARLFISAKTVDHHISAVLLKLDVDSRAKAVNEAIRRKIIA
jgi:DNA-binding CsgD family transcriptional regulator/tetratricopeptide (TPR) repeat protein